MTDDTAPPPTHKMCGKCKTAQPVSLFQPTNRKGGFQPLQSYCIPCLTRNLECDLCGVTFQRRRRGGGRKTEVPRKHLCDQCELTHRWCAHCDKVKSLDDFYAALDKPGGRRAHCKPCWSAGYESHARRLRTIAKYGLTVEQWQRMHDDQDGLCAICHREPTGGRWHTLYVDHDHKTGAVRGLLCANCNKGLGCFADNVDSLGRAADYLRAHSGG